MTKVSLEVESGTKPRNPYGPAHGTGASKSNAKLYFVLCLAFLAFAGMGKFFSVTSTKSKDPWADKGDAAGGWGSAHNHRIVDRSSANMDGRPTQQQPNVMNDEQGTAQSVPSYDHDYEYEYDYDGDDGDGDGDQSENLVKPVHEASYYHESMKNHKGKYSGYEPDQELRQADFYGEIWDLISIPTAPRPEYSDYQKLDGDFALAERLLFDMNTPHGKAFDFILNRDKRKISADDPHLIQRFVLALLFYATGGTDVDDPREFASGSSRSGNGGWDSEMAHFLTGLHECHWVKKSMNDQFWGILNMEGDTDKRVGVTKCNVDMEVTEIRLADLNMVGFIPEEIKYLSSLESLDVQNNHLAGHIPKGLGELDELQYLSLDGNNFSGTIPDVFENLYHLERAYLNFNDFNGSMPPSLCTLREDGSLADLWSDCGGYPITCTCCTVCCDMVAECDEMPSQVEGQS